jgi:DNA-binding NarL/FixJ family response regulator
MKPRSELSPWRRAVLDRGLTFRQIAAVTGVSYDTVKAYAKSPDAKGARKAPSEWQAAVIAFCREQAA